MSNVAHQKAKHKHATTERKPTKVNLGEREPVETKKKKGERKVNWERKREKKTGKR